MRGFATSYITLGAQQISVKEKKLVTEKFSLYSKNHYNTVKQLASN